MIEYDTSVPPLGNCPTCFGGGMVVVQQCLAGHPDCRVKPCPSCKGTKAHEGGHIVSEYRIDAEVERTVKRHQRLRDRYIWLLMAIPPLSLIPYFVLEPKQYLPFSSALLIYSATFMLLLCLYATGWSLGHRRARHQIHAVRAQSRYPRTPFGPTYPPSLAVVPDRSA